MSETATGPVIEGTWEEVARQAHRLAGKRVRLVVIQNGHPRPLSEARPFYATATPEERAQAWTEWCASPRPHVPPLSDAAISRESIYSPDEE